MNIDFYDSQPADRDACDASGPRPYIGVLFDCCGVYVRIYRRPEESTYRGRCPRCLRTATARIGPGGTSDRIFRAN